MISSHHGARVEVWIHDWEIAWREALYKKEMHTGTSWIDQRSHSMTLSVQCGPSNISERSPPPLPASSRLSNSRTHNIHTNLHTRAAYCFCLYFHHLLVLLCRSFNLTSLFNSIICERNSLSRCCVIRFRLFSDVVHRMLFVSLCWIEHVLRTSCSFFYIYWVSLNLCI